MGRMVCQFSCGAASAVATKLILAAYPAEEVVIVNAFIKEEHEDNRRFLVDCEKWFGHPVTVLRDEKYSASTDEVWRRERFMKGPHGAPCSRVLKRKLLATISLPDDVNVMGFTAEEADRLDDLREHEKLDKARYYDIPKRIFRAPLIERSLSHDDCLAIVERAGIELPMMYRMGYNNANCIGCPKGGQNYWKKIRRDFPERFVQIQTIQESIGPGAYFLRFTSGPRKDERMPLADLPLGDGNMADEPSFSCSFFCEIARQELAA